MAISFERHMRGQPRPRRPYGQRRHQRRGIRRSLTRFYGFAALAAVVVVGFAWNGAPLDRLTRDPLQGIVALWEPSAPEIVTSRYFPICSSGARVDCIVDGDTFWMAGENIRIADINTPEISLPAAASASWASRPGFGCTS